MEWWMWLIGGIALLAVEMVMPGGLFALFFGAGALAVSALAAFGAAGPGWLQWLLFAVLSLASLGLFRGRLVARLQRRGAPVDTLVGEVAVLLEDLAPGGVAKAELRGSSWEVRSTRAPMGRGRRCRVERVDGLTLWVVPEGE